MRRLNRNRLPTPSGRRSMQRALAGMAVIAVATGCQVQNPYAAFGPATVPPPGMQTPSPYYPPTTPALAAPPKSGPSAGSRASISAESTPLALAPRAGIVAEASDREPIRIVENPAPVARTAAAPSRSATPAGQTPSGGPISTQPSPAPATTPPSRPFGTAPAPGGASTNYTLDRSVAPATFQATPATPAGSAASGQWRAR
jgi:hypothetical protein